MALDSVQLPAIAVHWQSYRVVARLSVVERSVSPQACARLGTIRRATASLEGVLHTLEPGCQELAGVMLLLGFRKFLAQPLNRTHKPIDETPNVFLHALLVVGRRVFAQRLQDCGDDLRAGSLLAIKLVQQIPQLRQGHQGRPGHADLLRRQQLHRYDDCQ